MEHASRLRAITTLIGVAAVWGFTGPIIKDATHGYPVSLFLALQFGIALAALLTVSGRTLLSRSLWSPHNRKWLALAFLAGVADFAGYATQTVGLQTTTPGKAAFIVGLSVVMVPVILTVTRRRDGRSGLWLPVALSVIGLAFLVGQAMSFEFVVGDGWVLLSAFAFAVQIVLIGMLPKGMNPLTQKEGMHDLDQRSRHRFTRPLAHGLPWAARPVPLGCSLDVGSGTSNAAPGATAPTWHDRGQFWHAARVGGFYDLADQSIRLI